MAGRGYPSVNEKIAGTLYRLLRLALKTHPEDPAQWDDLPDFDRADWSELLAASRRQAVTGLVDDALTKIPQDLLRTLPPDIGTDFILETDGIVRKSREIGLLADTLLQLLNTEGIRALLMKGPAVAAFYPSPLHRTPGDIDLYCVDVRPEAALTLIKQRMGALCSMDAIRSPDGSSHCKIRGIDIDIHSHFFDFEVPGRVYPPVASPYATLLMLSSHILKHAMGPGVGLRQICDMAMACRALSGQYDQAQLRSIYRSHALLEWNILLRDFITLRLGLDTGFCADIAPSSVSSLEDIVMSGGNFGRFEASRSRALTQGGMTRKADTLLRFARRLPFAIKYAPRQYCTYLRALVKGNLGTSVPR